MADMLENSMVSGATEEYERRYSYASLAEELADQARIKQEADEAVDSADWWHDERGMSKTEAEQMERIWREFDKACEGDEAARTAVLAALHQIRKSAVLDEIQRMEG